MPRTKKEWQDTSAQHKYYDMGGKEKMSSYQKEYYEKHRDEKIEYNKRYREKKRREHDRKVITTQGTEFAGRVADRVSLILSGTTMMKFKQVQFIREHVASAIMEELYDICGIKEN